MSRLSSLAELCRSVEDLKHSLEKHLARLEEALAKEAYNALPRGAELTYDDLRKLWGVEPLPIIHRLERRGLVERLPPRDRTRPVTTASWRKRPVVERDVKVAGCLKPSEARCPADAVDDALAAVEICRSCPYADLKVEKRERWEL